MSLDVTVLNHRDRVSRAIGLGLDEHCELMRFAKDRDLPLLSRLHDYYSDAEIAAEEVPDFLEEVETVASSSGITSNLRSQLGQVADVARFAIAAQRPLAVLAD